MAQINLPVLMGQPQDKLDAIMNVLQTFREWKPELKPVHSELRSLAKEAIFWLDLKGVQTFHAYESGPLWASIWDSLHGSLESSIGRELEMLQSPRFKAQHDQDFWSAFHASYRSLLQDSFFATITYPIDCVLADKPYTTKRFTPLFNLWLAGNFPIGFDRRGYLIVIVAD